MLTSDVPKCNESSSSTRTRCWIQVYRIVYDDDEDEDIDEEGIKEHLRCHDYAFGKIVDSIVPEFD